MKQLSVSLRTFITYSTLLCAVLCTLLLPTQAHAHEVYVLAPEEVAELVRGDSPNPFSEIAANPQQFLFWVFIAIVTIGAVFLISISRRLEELIDPILFRIKKPYAILICRVTLGAALISSGWYGALFGPELPLTSLFPIVAVPYLKALLITCGALLMVGFATRLAAFVGIACFGVAVYTYGPYMLNYANYIGELSLAAFLGAHVASLDKKLLPSHKHISKIERFFETYAFLILRVAFGVSLIFASVYAKIIHSELALHTVTTYNLTEVFPFPPLFIVLGAALIEITLGVFYIIGFEIRFASLFLIFFLMLSLLYFGEAVWPHYVLFGTALALFTHGYDRYTIEGRFLKDAKHEPVL